MILHKFTLRQSVGIFFMFYLLQDVYSLIKFKDFESCDFMLTLYAEVSEGIEEWIEFYSNGENYQPWLMNVFSKIDLSNKCVINFIWRPLLYEDVYNALVYYWPKCLFTIILNPVDFTTDLDRGFSQDLNRLLNTPVFIILENSISKDKNEPVLWTPYFWRSRGWTQSSFPMDDTLSKSYLQSTWNAQYHNLDGRRIRVCYEGWEIPYLIPTCLQPIHHNYKLCYGAHRVLASLSVEYNFTVDFSMNWDPYCLNIPDASIQTDGYLLYRSLLDFIYNYKAQYLLYCESKDQFLSGNIWTEWIKPFEIFSWIGVIVSFLVSSIVFELRNIYRVHYTVFKMADAVFSNFSQLIRQYPHLTFKKGWHILLALVAIVLTTYYETIMTSYVISPPPKKVFQDLNELLDSGYKILVEDIGNQIQNESIYYLAFVAANITDCTKMSDSIRNYSHFIDFNRRVQLTTDLSLKGAFAVEDHFLGWAIAEMSFPNKNGSIRCHHVTQNFVRVPKGWRFAGAISKTVNRAMSIFFQEGLMSFWYEISYYSHNFGGNVHKSKVEWAEKQPVPLNLNVQFNSVFYIWGILLFSALLIFFIEKTTKSDKMVMVKVRVAFTFTVQLYYL